MSLANLLNDTQPANNTAMRALIVGNFGSNNWAQDDVYLGSIDHVMKFMNVTLALNLNDEIFQFQFAGLDDFKPSIFTEQCEQFKQLKVAMDAVRLFASGQTENLDPALLASYSSEFDIAKLNEDDAWVIYNLMRQMLEMRVSAVLAHPEFIELEQNWLLVHSLLVANSLDQENADRRHSHCILTLLNITAEQALEDIQSVSNLVDCQLFERIYGDELGQFGGHPFHIVNPLFELSESGDDIALLHGLGQIAASAQCIVNAGLKERFYTDPTLTAEPLTQPRFYPWRGLAEKPFSRYITLSAGHFNYRAAYAYESLTSGIGFQERSSNYCSTSLHSWYIYETARSYLKTGTALASKDGFNLAGQLSAHSVGGDQSALLNSERQHLLADLGINCPIANETFIGFTGRSQMSLALASLNSLSATTLLDVHSELLQLQNQFSRQLKVLIRETLGHTSPETVEQFVRDWLQPYVQSAGILSRSQAQRQPLAGIELNWQDQGNGSSQLNIHLKANLAEYDQPVDLALAVTA